MWTRVDWEEMGEESRHNFSASTITAAFLSLMLPTIASKLSFHILMPSMKEIHYHVLTRTQMQRETQSSKCGCSHLPVQVITGILKVSEEGDRAGKFRQLLSGQGGEPAVLKCTGGDRKHV